MAYSWLSLSARRAWIEMEITGDSRLALESLSARRAWIEIIMFVNLRVVDGVALRKESVDRNKLDFVNQEEDTRRSPQGERG